MTVHNEFQARSALTGGVIAGAAGGLGLWLIALFMNLARGWDIWVGMKFAAAPVLGRRALQPGFDALAVYLGLGTHFAVSIAWGALFALLFYGLSRIATVLCGFVWGLCVWFGMLYIAMPAIGLGPIARHMPVGVILVQHVIFGLLVAVAFLPFQHELPRGFFPRGLRHPI